MADTNGVNPPLNSSGLFATHFLNLTNGLEWIEEVPSPSLIRIESTAIEKADVWRIMRDLDSGFLMSVAIGRECHVYDCGTRRYTSKTISVGLPMIRDMLLRFWSGEPPSLLTDAAREAGRRLRYFRRYYQGRVRIVGHSRRTEHDGDVDFYREKLMRCV
jgi:hypothetical protein